MKNLVAFKYNDLDAALSDQYPHKEAEDADADAAAADLNNCVKQKRSVQ